MKKLVALVLVLVLVLAASATIAETYSAKAKVSRIDGKDAVILLNGLEYRVLKGELEAGDEVSLVMWNMNTLSGLDDVIMFAQHGAHAVHVEMMGNTPRNKTTAAK